EGRYGIVTGELKLLWGRGMGVQIAQLYEMVIPGLILSRHIFKGLRPRLFTDDSPDSDRVKHIYSRKPAFDVEIERGKTPGNPQIVKKAAPPGRVFVVIVSPIADRHKAKYPGLDGWLERWNWVKEDQGLQDAPENWLDRYDSKVYSGA